MNIILIISDTFRYDNLFDRAKMPVRTPNLDRLSERATSLSRMYTGSFPTIPHRTDLISGRCGWPWYGWQDLVKSTQNTMPKLLEEEGYVTQLICDCPHLFNSGFQKVFNAAQALRGQESDMPFLRMNYKIEDAMPREKTRTGHGFQDNTAVNLHRWTNRYWRVEEDRFPPRTARLAVEWLEENCRFDPFFLWVDFFDPHEPWDPPEYMVKKYDPDYKGTPMLHPNYGKAGDYTAEELKNLHAHYCAEAELVDRWVGRVLQKIDDLELWENSIVIFTTDHGMCLGDHNRTGKTNINVGDDRYWPLYPEIVHIPFMIASPGLEGGRTVETFAQPADILPTLLDITSAKVEPAEPFHGISFAPLLQGESEKPIHDFAVSGTYLREKKGKLLPGSTTPMLYTEEWAYTPVGSEGDPELYNIKNDPCAETNVASDNPKVMNDLHEMMLKWLKKIEAPAETIEALG